MKSTSVRKFRNSSLVVGAVVLVLVGCMTVDEIGPTVCDDQPTIHGTLVSPQPATTQDQIVLQYSRRYFQINSLDESEELVERIEVRNANGNLVRTIEQTIQARSGAGGATSATLTTDGPFAAGDYSVTLTLDADAKLNQFCSGIYVPTSRTDDFVVIEPPAPPDPDPDADPDPDSDSPMANAGPDQSVAIGQLVMLDGTASTGSSLTFSWTQTGGEMVSLHGADTATPSFTAPMSVASLTFELVVQDALGDSNNDTVIVSVTLGAQLFVVNGAENSVLAFDLAGYDDISGNVAPDARLAGAATGLSSPRDSIVNNAGELMVLNAGGADMPSITVYAGAADLANLLGNVAPTRTVQGNSTRLLVPASMAYDAANDLLFVGEADPPAIHVFATVSAPAFSGNVAPARSIDMASFSVMTPVSLFLADSGELYVTDDVANQILVFANAASISGVLPADRNILSPSFSDISSAVVTSDNQLLVTDRNTGVVLKFDNASSLNGLAAPAETLNVPNADELAGIVLGQLGHGLIVDQSANAIYDYEDVATTAGTVMPDRILQGNNTQLASPSRVYLNLP